MIHIEPGLYLRVQQLSERAPPLPLQSGFSLDVAYRALGITALRRRASAISFWQMTVTKPGSFRIGISEWSACFRREGTCAFRLSLQQAAPPRAQ